jgi:hypothetical protein
MALDIEFLRKKAVALRGLAQRAPELGDALRRLADEMDAKADELEARGCPDPIG